MESTTTPTSEEILRVHAQVYRHGMEHTRIMTLKCAVQLGIPDIIHTHGQPIIIPDLLSKLPTIPPCKAPFIYRIMRSLAQLGYFNTQKITTFSGNDNQGHHHAELAYSLTPLSDILLKARPTSLRTFILGVMNPHMLDMGHHLSDWLKSDTPGGVHEFRYSGKSLWEVAGENPELNLNLNEHMAGDTRLVMTVVVDKCKEAFEGLKTLIDVGGGNGTAATIIAEAFPGLRVTVYDLPHVVDTIPVNPLVGRVGGSMFESVPKADAILLKWILHDWSDEECIRILKNCREAVPYKEGKVMIFDVVLDDTQKDTTLIETQLLSDVAMIFGTNGKEREKNEWEKLFLDAGFSRYKITPIGFRSLIEVFP